MSPVVSGEIFDENFRRLAGGVSDSVDISINI
jgi:hypothetical protein